MRPAAPFALIALVAAVALALLVAHDRRSPAAPLIHASTDFSTFYCAGTVVRAGANPYRVEPARACQRALGESPGQPDWYVVPSPFPGYMLALFAALSLLPPYAAHLLWLYALFVAVGCTAWALARITGFPPLLVALLIVTPLGFYDVGFGEPTPLFAALVAFAAERAHRGAWRTCGVLAALAMLEPHLGLPAFLALLLFAPRARVALVATAAVLAIVSVAAIGVAENVEYFTRALPAQAASELHLRAQVSLSHLLAGFGAPPRVALALGMLSSIAATVAGIWAGRRLQLREEMPAALVLVPAAIGMIGGTYLHENHIVTALGAALLIARARTLPQWLAVAPLASFSVFWVADAAWRVMVLASALSALAGFALVALALQGSLAVRVVRACAYAFVCAVAFVAIERLPHPSGSEQFVAPPPPIAGDAQASDVWAYRNRWPPLDLADPRFEAQKLPYVLGLVLMFGCALAARGRTDRVGEDPVLAGPVPA